MAKKLSNGDTRHEQQLLAYAESCISSAYTYFRSKFENDLHPVLQAFKAGSFFSQHKISEVQPSAADINLLGLIPFLNSPETLNGLKTELPSYLAAAEDVSPQVNPIQWWKGHGSSLPKWANTCRSVLLMQPSSAAAERVFSLLSNTFSEQQQSSLEDYVELSIMLQYNF